MSKLGVHVSSGNRSGFGDFLAKAADAGNPVPVIFTVDQNVWPDMQQHSPQTVVVFRTQKNGRGEEIGDGPGGMYQGDPVQAARDWMGEMMPVWRQNPAHYYAPLNEQDSPTLPAFQWLNDFTVECLKVAEANGFKLALYAFSGGNPKDVDTPAPGNPPHTLEQAWHELLPSMQRAKANGHILLLHEYGFDSPAVVDDNGKVIAPKTTLRASVPNLATRYRRSYRYLHQFDADPPLVISESSAGVGGFTSIGLKIWLDDAKWYDSELMKDKVVIGCCLYQVGGAENIRVALPALTEYVSATPTPTTPLSGDLPVMPTDVTPTGERVTPVIPTGPTEPTEPTEPTGPTEPTEPTGPTEPTEPTESLPGTTGGPLDFDVQLIDCRKDPTRPNGIVLTFKINVTGGTGPYTYICEGQTLSGPQRDRPATRSGTIVESYTVTSSDGQILQKKFFFPASSFPKPHD